MAFRVQLFCPAFELVHRMQTYQKDYHKYKGNIEESCRESARYYVALSKLYHQIVSNISDGSRYDDDSAYNSNVLYRNVLGCKPPGKV